MTSSNLERLLKITFAAQRHIEIPPDTKLSDWLPTALTEYQEELNEFSEHEITEAFLAYTTKYPITPRPKDIKMYCIFHRWMLENSERLVLAECNIHQSN